MGGTARQSQFHKHRGLRGFFKESHWSCEECAVGFPEVPSHLMFPLDTRAVLSGGWEICMTSPSAWLQLVWPMEYQQLFISLSFPFPGLF